jgi:phospholipid-transporting ATPase
MKENDDSLEINDINYNIEDYLLPKKEDVKDNIEQDIYAVFINNPLLNDLHENNITDTSKYRWQNFLAKILVEQFSRIVNIYFLIIAVFQSIKEVSYSDGAPLILLPFSYVILLNGLKDIYEDFKRKKADKIENNNQCLVYNELSQNFISKKWSQIKLGDIIKVKNNEQFPADLLLLSTSEDNGICYVETKNIDGETNLKQQEAISSLHKRIKLGEKLSTLKYVCITKQPNEFIYKFDATLYETDFNGNIENRNKYLLLNKKSLLLKGCSLRQTDYIIGVSIYIGQHTKSMINSPNLKCKHSSIEIKMNRFVIYIFFIQVTLCAILSICYLIVYNVGYKDFKSYLL